MSKILVESLHIPIQLPNSGSTTPPDAGAGTGLCGHLRTAML